MACDLFGYDGKLLFRVMYKTNKFVFTYPLGLHSAMHQTVKVLYLFSVGSNMNPFINHNLDIALSLKLASMTFSTNRALTKWLKSDLWSEKQDQMWFKIQAWFPNFSNYCKLNFRVPVETEGVLSLKIKLGIRNHFMTVSHEEYINSKTCYCS